MIANSNRVQTFFSKLFVPSKFGGNRTFRVDCMSKRSSEEMGKKSLMWFRKGLRLHDNPALLRACEGKLCELASNVSKFHMLLDSSKCVGILAWCCGWSEWRCEPCVKCQTLLDFRKISWIWFHVWVIGVNVPAEPCVPHMPCMKCHMKLDSKQFISILA